MPAKFDKLRLAIKRQLKKDNPNMKEDEIERRSFAVATSQAKKLGIKTSESFEEKVEDKFDEEGRFIVSENTKFYISAGINSIEE